eukprot:scaffold5075_cov174-Amphora_coffeaeformis.AAC.5
MCIAGRVAFLDGTKRKSGVCVFQLQHDGDSARFYSPVSIFQVEPGKGPFLTRSRGICRTTKERDNQSADLLWYQYRSTIPYLVTTYLAMQLV